MEEIVFFKDIFDFQHKSKIRAKEGLNKGAYPFYTSSKVLSKYVDYYEKQKPYLGESLIIGTGGSPSIHYQDEAFYTSTDCFVVNLKNDFYSEFETKFIYYYLFGNIHILQKGFKGAGLKHISKEYINKIEIPKFNLEEQRNYIKQFDKIQMLVNRKKKIKPLFEEYLISTFLDLFGDPIINNKNWREFSFRELIELDIDYRGKTPKKSETGIPLISSANIKNGKIDLSVKQFISEEAYPKWSLKGKTQPEDLIITTEAPAGEVALLPKIGTFQISRRVIAFRLKKIVSPYFVLCLMRTKNWNRRLSKYKRGGTVERILKESLLEQKIIVPNKDLQSNFEKKYLKVDNLKTKNEASILVLEELFQTLLYRTFNKNEVETKKDEVGLLIEDDILIENLLNSLNGHEYSSPEAYDEEVKKLFEILNRTNENFKDSRKGIVQKVIGKEVIIQTQKEYQDNK